MPLRYTVVTIIIGPSDDKEIRRSVELLFNRLKGILPVNTYITYEVGDWKTRESIFKLCKHIAVNPETLMCRCCVEGADTSIKYALPETPIWNTCSEDDMKKCPLARGEHDPEKIEEWRRHLESKKLG